MRNLFQDVPDDLPVDLFETVGRGEGDWLEFPAHTKHRVAWTDPARDTISLAVHYPAATE